MKNKILKINCILALMLIIIISFSIVSNCGFIYEGVEYTSVGQLAELGRNNTSLFMQIPASIIASDNTTLEGGGFSGFEGNTMCMEHNNLNDKDKVGYKIWRVIDINPNGINTLNINGSNVDISESSEVRKHLNAVAKATKYCSKDDVPKIDYWNQERDWGWTFEKYAVAALANSDVLNDEDPNKNIFKLNGEEKSDFEYFQGEETQKIVEECLQYGESVKDSANTKLTALKCDSAKVTPLNNGTITIGPLTYTSDNGNNVIFDNIEINENNANGSYKNQLYTDALGTTSITNGSIKPNQQFYIKANNSIDNANKIKVKVEVGEKEYYKARIMLFRYSGLQTFSIFNVGDGSVKTDKQDASCEFPNNKGNLRIQKKGIYLNTSNNVENMGFRIYYKDGNSKRYVTITTDAKKTAIKGNITGYKGTVTINNQNTTTDPSKALVIYTGANGYAQLNNICTDYTYYIEEDTSYCDYSSNIISMTKQIDNGAENNINGEITVAKRKTTTVKVTDDIKRGKIEIEKQDQGSGAGLQGVTFKIRAKNVAKWVVASGSDGSYSLKNYNDYKNNNKYYENNYTTDESKATVFTTNKDGKITINGLDIGAYFIHEISNNNYGYTDTKITGAEVNSTNLNSSKINNNRVEVEVAGSDDNKKTTVIKIKNQKQTGNLVINKRDKDSNATLNGIQFRLKKDGKYVRLNNKDSLSGTNRITSLTLTDENQATVLTTSGSGQIKLVNLLIGNYQLEEISVGSTYYGYTVDSTRTKVDGSYIYVETSNTAIGNSNGKPNVINVTVTRQTSNETNNTNTGTYNTLNIYNRKKYVRVSGNVWEDGLAGKNNTFNNLFDSSSDIKIQNLKVTLKNSNGTDVTKIETESRFTNPTYTDANGHYAFDDVLIDSLGSYYIEFEYDGEIYTTTKSFNELGQNNSNAEPNRSKAQESSSSRTTLDNKYNNVVGTSNASQSRVNNSFNVNYNLTSNNANTDASVKSKNMGIFEGQLLGKVRNVGRFVAYENYNAVNKITATTKETGYGVLGGVTVDNIRKNGTTELSNRNCGLVQREQVDLSVATDLENVIVSVNGYTNTYNYRKGREKAPDDFRLDVKANKWGYFRSMYASDIIYTGNDTCKVYMTYSITVRNNSNTLSATVTNLANYHDSRYVITKTGFTEAMTDNVSSTWTGKKDAGSGYTVEYTNKMPQIAAGESKKIYVQYELSTSAVVAILSGNVVLNNVAEVNGYTTYYGANTYYHSGRRTGIYASIDKDSAPGNLTLGNASTYEDDTMQAPTLTMKLTTNERTIEGNVFEDVTVEDIQQGEERLGDGIYKPGTDRNIGNAQVELYEYDATKQPGGNEKSIWTESVGSIASVWKQVADATYVGATTDVTKEGKTIGKKIDAIVKTDASGHYKIQGIVPGKYILKFTYGDGSVIYGKPSTDQNGNELPNTTLDRADYYKSTIIKSADVRTALEQNPKQATMWYKTSENAGRYSDAADDLTAYNSSNSEEIKERTIYRSIQETATKIATKSAYSAPMNIKFELVNSGNETADSSNPTGNTTTTNVTQVVKANSDGTKQVETVLAYNTNNVDFGIVNKAKQNYEIQKEISNIKITLANGQVLVDGNPSSQNLQYVKYLVNTPFKRANMIDIEIDNELLTGSTLEVTYTVKAINESEVNYRTYGYYYFAEDRTNIETLKVSKIIDYFDDDLVYDQTSATKIDSTKTEILIGRIQTESGVDYIVLNDSANTKLLATDYLNNNAIQSAKKYNSLLILQSEKALTPLENENTEEWTYKASRVLTTSDKLEFNNNAESIEVKTSMPPSTINKLGSLDPNSDISTLNSSQETDFFSEQIAITSPTGENRTYIEYIIGAIALVVLGTGIVIIKRKAL